MNYFWTDCPGCGCQVAVNDSVYPNKVSGSLRRWSRDRSINDGRAFEIPLSELSPGGAFRTKCVCGQEIEVAGVASREAVGSR